MLNWLYAVVCFIHYTKILFKNALNESGHLSLILLHMIIHIDPIHY